MRLITYALLGLFILASCNGNAQKTNLTVQEFEEGVNKNNIQILDVRTSAEYATGHLSNALLADWNNEKEFKERSKALDKNRPIYTYCLSGARSNSATAWLINNGYTAYNLKGGINAWKNSNKPMAQVLAVKQITSQEYLDAIPKDKTTLVDFNAIWCAPCKKMNPILDSLIANNLTPFTFIKINGGDQNSICKELNIEAFPTFIIYKNGVQVWRKQGIISQAEFEENLK